MSVKNTTYAVDSKPGVCFLKKQKCTTLPPAKYAVIESK
jgi:hypothetical protein